MNPLLVLGRLVLWYPDCGFTLNSEKEGAEKLRPIWNILVVRYLCNFSGRVDIVSAVRGSEEIRRQRSSIGGNVA